MATVDMAETALRQAEDAIKVAKNASIAIQKQMAQMNQQHNKMQADMAALAEERNLIQMERLALAAARANMEPEV